MWGDGKLRMTGNVGVLSELTLVEDERKGPYFCKYRPMSPERIARLTEMAKSKVAGVKVADAAQQASPSAKNRPQRSRSR